MTEAGDKLPVRTSDDVVRVRQLVRQRAQTIGLSVVDQTKIVTAASEIARNTLDHGGGGEMTLYIVTNGLRRGLKLVFEDRGPGIPDVDLAMSDGYTSRGGMGLGLPGSKRLCNEFGIESAVGVGTKVTLIRWK